MVPVSFEDENVVLAAPPSIRSEQCEVINACMTVQDDGLPVTVTCWKFSVEDLERITRTGRMWMVVAGHEMMPVYMTTENPFDTEVPNGRPTEAQSE